MRTPRAWQATPRHWLAAAGVAAGAGTILSGAGLMTSSGYLISRAAERPPVLDLMVVFVAVRFFGLARPALRYLERLASHDVTFRALRRVRRWFCGALLPLAPARLTAFSSGDLLGRLASDVDSLQETHLRIVAPTLVAIVSGIVVVGGLACIDRRLATIVLSLLIASGALWPLVARRQARGIGARRNGERAAFGQRLVPMLQGLEDVLALGREREELAHVVAYQQALDALDRRDGRAMAVHAAMSSLFPQLGLWSALALTMPLIVEGRIPSTWVAAVALGIVAAFEAVEGLPTAWHFRDQVEDAARRVFEVIDVAPAVTDPVEPAPVPAGSAPALSATSVRFGYGHGAVLSDVTFQLAPGEHVALVGPSGSGKSTLLSLLVRTWDPSAGRIDLGGRDLRSLRLADLRASIAVMPQDVYVFDSTLRDNVSLANPHASDAEAALALRQAGLERFLAGLPHELDTRLGEHGCRMSAGERQRLGLARLMLSNARLVLVDEPTANLDTETERDVLRTLRQWARGRTLLLVTHRLVGLDAMDRVLVLDHGSLVQQGPHAALRSSSGLYARLLKDQAGLLPT